MKRGGIVAVVLVCAFTLLPASESLAAEGPFVGPDIALAEGQDNQQGPVIAFAPEVGIWLAVWRDGNNGHLWASRLDPSGAVLDTFEFTREFGSSPAVAWGDGVFLVAWTTTCAGCAGDGDIRGARIRADGTMLDGPPPFGPGPFTIAEAVFGQLEPAVAFAGDNFLVAWTDTRNSTDADQLDYDVYAVLVGADKSAGQDFAIATGSAFQEDPAIAFDGTNALVAITASADDSLSVHGYLVTPQGDLPDGDGFLIADPATFSSGPAVAWSGSMYLVVWTRCCFDVAGARVRPDGTLFSADLNAIDISSDAGSQGFPALVAWNGSAFQVAWDDTRSALHDVYGARVGTDGKVAASDAAGVLLADPGDMFRANVSLGQGPDGRSAIVFTRPQPNDGENAFARFVDATAAVFTSGPGKFHPQATATLTFTSSVSDDFLCDIDGAGFAPCSSPLDVEGSDTTHSVKVTVAGHLDDAAERTWTVDLSSPIVAVDEPAGGTYLCDAAVVDVGPVVAVGKLTVRAGVSDAQSGISSVAFLVNGVERARFGPSATSYTFTYDPPLGPHTVTVRGTNGAGAIRDATLSVIGIPDVAGLCEA